MLDKDISEQFEESLEDLAGYDHEKGEHSQLIDFIAARFKMVHQKVYIIFMIGFVFIVIIGKSLITFFKIFAKRIYLCLRNLCRVISKNLQLKYK